MNTASERNVLANVPGRPQVELMTSLAGTPTTRPLGLDVSKWQGTMNWGLAKERGIEFAFLRAGQGTASDPQFSANVEGCQTHQIPWAPYWYWREDLDPRAQAARFHQVLENAVWDLYPVADIEHEDPGDSDTTLDGTRITTFVQETMNRLAAQKVLIYTGLWVWDRVWGGAIPSQGYHPLWIAQYPWAQWWEGLIQWADTRDPQIPAEWADWTFWQFTAKGPGRFYGAQSSEIDMNFFNGTRAEFRALFSPDPPSPPPPPEDPETGVWNLSLPFNVEILERGTQENGTLGLVKIAHWVAEDDVTPSGGTP